MVKPDPRTFIGGFWIYDVNTGLKTNPLPARDVLYVQRPNPNDPHRGLSVLESIRDVIESDKISRKWNMASLNSGVKKGVFHLPRGMTKKSVDDFRERVKETIQSEDDPFFYLASDETSFTPLSVSQGEVEYISQLQQSKN
jgi:phage portal protein BeeE